MFGRQLFLFLEPGTNPTHDRVTTDCDGVETLLMWAPDAASAAGAAAREAELGIDIVELYRGFTPGAAAAVVSTVGDRATVGFAVYPHGVQPPRRINHSATIFRSGPGPHRPILRQHPGGGSTVVVGSSDPASSVALAQGFADDGFDLVELCGGEPLTTAAEVGETVAGRAALSYVVYPYDSLAGAAAYKASFADAG